MKVSISQAAKELGVTAKTLRRWEEQDKIDVERTVGGHRRYDLAKLQGVGSKKASTRWANNHRLRQGFQSRPERGSGTTGGADRVVLRGQWLDV